VSPLAESGDNDTKLNELTKAAGEGFLTQFLDTRNVSYSLIQQFFQKQSVFTSLENVLQTLWFGGNVEWRDALNHTALHVAAKYGTKVTVTALLEYGAIVNVRAFDGKSPLHYAAGWGKPEVVRVLLQARASTSIRDNKEWSPLHNATRYGVYESVKLLLEAESDVNAKIDGGWTPLMLAGQNQDATVAELLKFDANVHDKDGTTDVFKLASSNEGDGENILKGLAASRAFKE